MASGLTKEIQSLVRTFPGLSLARLRRILCARDNAQIALAINNLLSRGRIWLAPNDCYYVR